MSDGAVMPFGDEGPATDRGTNGRFLRGNRAAVVAGERSVAFWEAEAAVRREIAADVVADKGLSSDNASRALRLAADGIAQAALVRDSAFARVVESGGPMTSSGRTRRAFTVWLAAMDRLERHLRLVGLDRQAKDIGGLSAAQYLEAQRRQAPAPDPKDPQ